VTRPPRRAVLRTAAAGFAALSAGCASSFSETDERVDARPPGDPPLDPGGAWPAYRFDAGNTGANPDGEGLREGEAHWRLNAGGAATVADGRLYNVYDRDRATATLTVRDPATAATQSRTSLVEYGVNGPPVVGADRVFVTTFDEVIAVDPAGGELWRGPKMDGIRARPTVHDGRVLVNSGGFEDSPAHLRAFDADGTQRWRHDHAGDASGTPAVAGGHAFVVTDAGLHAVDLASGEELFSRSDVASRDGTPVARDGAVYVVDSPDERPRLVALDAADGTTRWTASVEPGLRNAPPVATADAVYARGADGLLALDPADGSVVASTDRVARPVGLVGDVLYAAADGTLFAFDAADLTRRWSLTTEEVTIQDTVGRIVHHVTPVDGAVYVDARDAFYGVGPPR
jgi:outer membrane protein assembly factor BamB